VRKTTRTKSFTSSGTVLDIFLMHSA
jgi:hypothetical protein